MHRALLLQSQGFPAYRNRIRKRLLADKAYDADSLRKWLNQRKGQAVVPSAASRRTPYPLDSRAYKRRNLIERASSRTGDASQPDMTAMRKTISLVSLSQQ